jgi:hypothetical protein
MIQVGYKIETVCKNKGNFYENREELHSEILGENFTNK